MDLNSYYDSLKSKCSAKYSQNGSLDLLYLNNHNSSGNKGKNISETPINVYGGDSQGNNNSDYFPIYTYNYILSNPKYDWQIENYMEGSGTFGGVYKAKDLNTNQQYALKFINFHDENDYSYRIGINEAKILRKLASYNESSHIIKLYDYYINEDQFGSKYLILALELCECSVEDLIAVRHECNSPWKPEEIFYLADEIVKSVLFLKQLKIAHLDIKPSNILFTMQESRYKLADFGFAQQLGFNDDITQLDTNIRGTAIFMAPIFYNSNSNTVSHNPFKSDVFSLGATLLHMIMPALKREDIENFHSIYYKQAYPEYYELINMMLTPEEKDRKDLEEISLILDKLPKLKPNDENYIDVVKTKKMAAGNLLEAYKKMIKLAIGYEKIYKFGQTFFYYNKALEYAMNINQEEVANCYYLMGKILELLCDYPKSTEYLKKALEIRFKIYGKDHSSLADLYTLLSFNYSRMNDNIKALEAGYESLRIIEQASKKSQNDSGNALCSQFSFMKSKVLSHSRELQMAQAYHAMGWVEHRQGKLNQALENFQKAQVLIESVVGFENLRMGTVLNHSGIVYYLMGQFDKSQEILRISYKIRKNALGKFHYETARSLNSLGQVHIMLSEYEKSKKYLEKALLIRLNAFGETHLETTQSLNLIGVLNYRYGKIDEARTFAQKTFDIRKKILENQNTSDEFTTILCNLGVMEHSIGNCQLAFQYFLEALKLESSYKNSIKAGFIMNNMAYIQIENKLPQEAEKNLLGFKEILGRSETINQFNYAIQFNNMGVLKGSIGCYNDAYTSFKVSLELLKFKQQYSYYYAVVSANFACILMKLKDWSNCLKHFLNSLHHYKNLFGFRHPDCDLLFYNIARMFQTMDFIPMNKEMLEDIDSILKKLELGKEGLYKHLEKKREELRQGSHYIGFKLEYIFINLFL